MASNRTHVWTLREGGLSKERVTGSQRRVCSYFATGRKRGKKEYLGVKKGESEEKPSETNHRPCSEPQRRGEPKSEVSDIFVRDHGA